MDKIPADLIKKLREPLPKEAVKPHPTKTYLSTIKAIYVVERFNDVFGLGGWNVSNEVVETSEKFVVVRSTFSAPEYGIVVKDIYGGNDNPDRGDAYKGACTDALTKIGSYLYVGMDVFKGLSERGAEPEKPAKPTKTASGKLVDGAIAKIDAAMFVGDCEAVITKAHEYRIDGKLSADEVEFIVKEATKKRTLLEEKQK